MLPEQVDEMLKNYKSYSGRCAHLEIAIEVAERELKRMRAAMIVDAAHHVQRYDTMDMPRGTDIGTPTEDIAIRFATGYETHEVREKADELEVMRQEYAQKLITVNFVEAWLTGLTEKDRWLITEQVVEGRFWREVAYNWHKKFGEPISKEWIRKRKAVALKRIYEMAM